MSRSVEEWADAYAELQPLHEAFADRLRDLLETLLHDAGHAYWHSYSWARNRAQFAQALARAKREGKRVDEPFLELREMVGLNFVGWTPADLPPIAEIVERELEIDYASSQPLGAVRDGATSAEAELRYPHAFYVVRLGESRRTLTEWRAYDELTAEVHVSTLSQYAWWCLESGHLRFAWPTSYTPGSREAFARVAQLLESVDDVLEREAVERERVVAEYEDAIAGDELDLPLNGDSLAAYLRHSEIMADLVALAEDEGMRPEEGWEADSQTLEQELLWLLERRGLRTLRDLDTLLRDSAGRARAIYGDVSRLASEHGFQPYALGPSVITFLLAVLSRFDSETIELLDYRDELSEALNLLIGNTTPALEDDA